MAKPFFLILLLALALLPGSIQAGTNDPVQDGKLNLIHWNPQDKATINLKGDWEFYWSQLLDPSDFKTLIPEKRSLIPVPGSWSRVSNYPEKGFATYRLRVQLSHVQELAIYLSGISSATRVYIDDKLVHEVGRVGPRFDKSVYEPLVRDRYLVFTPAQADFDIIVQAASFEFFMAGIVFPIRLGNPQAILDEKEADIIVGSFLVGSLFIMIIYHLFLFAMRTKTRSTLYFALWMCSILGYMLSVQGSGLRHLAPDLSFSGGVRLFNTWILGMPPFAHFTYELFPKQYSKRVPYLFAALCYPLYVLILCTEPRFFMPATTLAQIGLLVIGIYTFYALAKAIRAKENGAVFFVTGASIAILTAIHDALQSSGYIQSVPLAPMGFFVFNFFQSTLIARRFSNAFIHIEQSERAIRHLSEDLKIKHEEVLHLNANLEQKVEEKTRVVKGLLDHIPQGILSIGSKGIIDLDGSAHLMEVFENRTITGQFFKTAILDSCELNADVKDQIWQTILACIDNHVFSFDVNSDKLPTEMTFLGNKKKILRVTWNVRRNDQIVESILVTFLDITAEKQLEMETQKQQEEILRIQQLIEISEDKANQFFSTSAPLLQEIQTTLQNTKGRLDRDRIKLLFVNAHTVKGASRTLRLHALTEAIHKLESEYALILKENKPIDIEILCRDIQDVMTILHDYLRINRDKLNRSSDNTTITIKRDFIEEHYYLIKDFIDKKSIDHEQFLQTFISQAQRIANLIFEELPGVFDDYRDMAIKIAKDIGREEPLFDFDIPVVSISTELRALLDKCMIHLIRNALDHGIESADEREASGKSPRGTLKFHGKVQEGILNLSIQDDGRGLAVSLLHEKGFKSGRLSQQSTPQEIARTIFESGTSTANAITDVSGRGIGMSAVQSFLHTAGGSIEVVIAGPKPDRPGYFNFHFSLALPLGENGQRSLPMAS